MRRWIFFPFRFYKKLDSLLSKTGLGKINILRNIYRPFYNFLFNFQYKWLYNKIKPERYNLINVQGSKMYMYNDDTGIAPMLFTDGIMEEYETKLYKEIVREGMIVIDVGANIGYYSLIGAKLVGKKGIIYAFEPEPSVYEILRKNIEVNSYNNIVAIRKAVSNNKGKIQLWTNKVDMALSSFSKENVLSFFNHEVSEKVSSIEVDTISLDDFFQNVVRNTKVDVIKIDSQGMEGFVIDGADKILRNNNISIIMEFWPDGLRRLGTDPLLLLSKLQQYGFEIKCIRERKAKLEHVSDIVQFCSNAKPREEFNLVLIKGKQRIAKGEQSK